MTPNFKYSERIFTLSRLKRVPWQLLVRRPSYSHFSLINSTWTYYSFHEPWKQEVVQAWDTCRCEETLYYSSSALSWHLSIIHTISHTLSVFSYSACTYKYSSVHSTYTLYIFNCPLTLYLYIPWTPVFGCTCKCTINEWFVPLITSYVQYMYSCMCVHVHALIFNKYNPGLFMRLEVLRSRMVREIKKKALTLTGVTVYA